MTIETFSLTELVGALGSPSGPLLETFDAALADPGAFNLSDLPVAPELIDAMQDNFSKWNTREGIKNLPEFGGSSSSED